MSSGDHNYGDSDRDAAEDDEEDVESFSRLSVKAGKVFVPSTPISQQQMFAGRIRQLQGLLDAIDSEGQHAVVYGERGVGKTSLVSIVQLVVRAGGDVAIRENCHAGDSYGTLWRRAFENVRFTIEKQEIGFAAAVTRSSLTSLADSAPVDPSPFDVTGLLRQLPAKVVFIFDEFDQLSARTVSQSFAETIKALSDHNVDSRVILVGVGDTVDSLLASHASVERAIVQVQMPRMKPDELAQIIERGCKALGMEWVPQASKRVVQLSQGLPHYVHRLGLFATRQALAEGQLRVTMEHVRYGMREAVETASQSLTDAYLKATSSQRKDSLFGTVLLGCALARGDELGYFRPFDIKKPLKVMGHNFDVPAFASHLNKFASAERGNILQKTGTERQWRYRFSNPLIQPYVIIRGIADDAISSADVDRVLTDD